MMASRAGGESECASAAHLLAPVGRWAVRFAGPAGVGLAAGALVVLALSMVRSGEVWVRRAAWAERERGVEAGYVPLDREPRATMTLASVSVRHGSLVVAWERVVSTPRGLMGFGVLKRGWAGAAALRPKGSSDVIGREPDHWNSWRSWSAGGWWGAGLRIDGPPRRLVRVRLPLWALATGGVGLWGLGRWVSRPARRRAAGLCARCGYARADLPARAPCPECGAGI